MGIIWGLLKKALTDDTTIEERIAEMIADHDNSPTSHLGETGSLQSHAASAIIDHLAGSIIADKYADGSVDVEKLSWNKMFLYPSLESPTGWNVVKTGSYANVTMGICDCAIIPGRAIGNMCSIGLQYNGPLECDPYYYPALELRAAFFTHAYFDMNITVGSASIFDLDSGGFGFEQLTTDTKVQCFYINAGVKTRFALTITNPQYYHRYRAECVAGTVSGKYTLNFYVDGLLVQTCANVYLDFSNDHAFVIGAVNRTVRTSDNYFYVSCLAYSQNYS